MAAAAVSALLAFFIAIAVWGLQTRSKVGGLSVQAMGLSGRLRGAVGLAATLPQIAPELLGADGPRTHLVLGQTSLRDQTVKSRDIRIRDVGPGQRLQPLQVVPGVGHRALLR